MHSLHEFLSFNCYKIILDLTPTSATIQLDRSGREKNSLLEILKQTVERIFNFEGKNFFYISMIHNSPSTFSMYKLINTIFFFSF